MAQSERSSQCCAEGRGNCFKLDRVPAPNALALQCAQDFMARVAGFEIDVCPACKVVCLRVVAVMKGSQRLPGPGVVLTPNEQGPPREA